MIEYFENLLSWINDQGTLLLSLVAIILSFRYQRHSKKLANDRMLKDLFTEFNTRYDVINNDLDFISRFTEEEWSLIDVEGRKRYHGVIVDFFNICAEEYYWHKEGRINGDIWKSWSKGMNDIYQRSKIIRDVWRQECENEGYKSYYLNSPNEIFK